MCNYCHNSRCNGGCRQNYSVCNPQPCCNNGPCPEKFDAQCIIYHKDNNVLSGLVNLGLSNGATAQLIFDTIDTYIGQIKAANWALPCLRADYTITTLQQFGQAVDTVLCGLQDQINTINDSLVVPIDADDSLTIAFTTSGILDHTITASVKVSALTGNRLSIVGDGLVAAPQTLSINYATKELTIVDGNTVDLSSLVCGVGGYLGNQTVDPSAENGQYWYRTDTDELKIQLNGTVRQIPIV